jgi:uncharacterized protein YdeI (YjbR/CyaY-like superfamily)
VNPKFFRTPADWRRWLERHHADAIELWVGFHKRDSGKPSITWPESVDEALCFGWIDGVRKRLNGTSYVIRFTPRKRDSTWSLVNTRRVKALIQAGRMRPAGLEAFRARRPEKSGTYSFENRPQRLPSKYQQPLRANPAAWAYYRARPPWYQRTVCHWIVSAKKEETRLRRLAALIQDSAAGRLIGPLRALTKTERPASVL